MTEDERETSNLERLVSQPRVSVLMTTYNHAEYLADAIEGVAAQRADFDFELLIGEDASTDTTRQIALDYQQKYPALVRVVVSNGNVGTHANIRRLFARARGEFIAFCEGDDAWCTEDKLARQVALFDNDARVGGVHSNWARMHRRDGQWVTDWRRSVHRRIPSKLLEGNLFETFYFPKILRTCTVVYRRSALLEYYASPLGVNKYRFGDAAMAAFITSKWRIGYLPQVTAVYRLSPGSSLRSGRKARLLHMKSSLQFDSDARRYFDGRNNYPTGYRWEIDIGMLLWGLVVPDFRAVQFAIRDLWRHFRVGRFLGDGWKSLRMRLPSVSPQR